MSLQKLKNVYFLGSLIKNIKGIYDKVNEIIDYLNGTSGEGSYKVYIALLTQTGTNAPVATVLKNTLGNIVWSRFDQGSYIGTLNSAFTEDKTLVIIPNQFIEIASDSFNSMEAGVNNTNSVFVKTKVVNYGIGTYDNSDELLVNYATSIEIRVYN